MKKCWISFFFCRKNWNIFMIFLFDAGYLQQLVYNCVMSQWKSNNNTMISVQYYTFNLSLQRTFFFFFALSFYIYFGLFINFDYISVSVSPNAHNGLDLIWKFCFNYRFLLTSIAPNILFFDYDRILNSFVVTSLMIIHIKNVSILSIACVWIFFECSRFTYIYIGYQSFTWF